LLSVVDGGVSHGLQSSADRCRDNVSAQLLSECDGRCTAAGRSPAVEAILSPLTIGAGGQLRLRHFLFTWLKSQGMDDALIQPYSGHESRTSLKIYSRRIALSNAQQTYDGVIDQFPV
jgi:hypothetical protein